MEIKIGILHSGRELTVSLAPDTDVDATITSLVGDLDEKKTLRLTDAEGRITIVPADCVAYAEVRPEAARTVGFGDL